MEVTSTTEQPVQPARSVLTPIPGGVPPLLHAADIERVAIQHLRAHPMTARVLAAAQAGEQPLCDRARECVVIVWSIAHLATALLGPLGQPARIFAINEAAAAVERDLLAAASARAEG